ncbi:MAG: archaeosortase/exosortase family protein, partial [Anaerolineales bacterium]|nr:archaeosortase/exosortase family protein [Anaerolineales bacterium]
MIETNNPTTQPAVKHTSQPKLPTLLVNMALFGLWLWLFRPVFSYFQIIFVQEDFRTNQLVLLTIVILLAVQIRRQRFHPSLFAPVQVRFWPLVLVLSTAVLFLLSERYLDINMLTAVLFGLGGYGLAGLWLAPHTWRNGLPVALLLIGALPFGTHMQTFIGYPMRLSTAALVRDGLQLAGVTSVGVDTILVFENGVSTVDLPCSGVQSLWTGLLFLLAATWVEQKRLGWRWLLTAVLFTGLLFLTNLVRVALLVTVGEVARWRVLAEMLHVPLGVLGFVLACAGALLLLRFFVPQTQPTNVSTQPTNAPAHRWIAPLLAATFLGLSFLYVPRPEMGLTGTPPTLAFPAELALTPEPLKADERAWL